MRISNVYLRRLSAVFRVAIRAEVFHVGTRMRMRVGSLCDTRSRGRRAYNGVPCRAGRRHSHYLGVTKRNNPKVIHLGSGSTKVARIPNFEPICFLLLRISPFQGLGCPQLECVVVI